MAFKLTKSPAFTAKITVMTPNERAGYDRSTLVARYRRTNVDETLELRQLPPKECLERVLIGWEEFVDDDNNPVPFNEHTLQAILGDPAALVALYDGFVNTIIKAREKN
jgi:hypothetical protein